MIQFIKKNIFELFIYILLLIWLYWSWNLVYKNIIIWDICPNILWIPACYIILFFFIALFIIQTIRINKKYFYIIVSIPLFIAMYASIFQITWNWECPKTSSGIPMCYISLFLFSSLLIVKILNDFYTSNKIMK